MRVPFFILNFKGYKKDDAGQHCHAEHYVKTFHDYFSLSFGVTKYAKIVNSRKVAPRDIPTVAISLPAIALPTTPAVSTYFAASAKMAPTSFLLSLFTSLLYHNIRSMATRSSVAHKSCLLREINMGEASL